MAPRQRPSPRRPSREKTEQKTPSAMAAPGLRARQESAPPDGRHVIHAMQSVVENAPAHDEVKSGNTSTMKNTAQDSRCEPDRHEMGDINFAVRRRTIAPCPCPEDELVMPFELNRKRAADFRKVDLAGIGDDLDRLYGPPLDDRDQRGYCRMMAKLIGLDVSAGYKTPTNQRLRNRLVTEQTWYDLQAKMFLPPPVTNDRPITAVLNALDQRRLKTAKKERVLWKTVRLFFPLILSKHPLVRKQMLSSLSNFF